MDYKSVDMPRLVRLLCSLSLLLPLFSGCGLDKGITYEGGEGISFVTDSLYYSFGDLPFNVTDTELIIPLEVLGKASDKPRPYRLILTADRHVKEGIHYMPVTLDRILPAGAYHDTLRVRILRTALDEHTLYTLKLRLEANDAFPSGIRELREVKISFSNRLDMPTWWHRLSYWIGEYDPRKYRKFIELNGGTITDDKVVEDLYATLRVFKEVKDFFDMHPQYGVIFPDVYWEI